MSKIAKIIQEYADMMGWPGAVDIEDECGAVGLAVRIAIEDQACKLFVEYHPAQNGVSMFLYPSFSVRASQRSEALAVLNAVNRNIRFGRFEMEPDSGELRYRHAIDIDHLELNALALRDMSDAAAACLAHWLGPLAEVALTNRSARRILEDLDEPGSTAEAGMPDNVAAFVEPGPTLH